MTGSELMKRTSSHLAEGRLHHKQHCQYKRMLLNMRELAIHWLLGPRTARFQTHARGYCLAGKTDYALMINLRIRRHRP